MMNHDLTCAVTNLAQRFFDQAMHDDGLREDLRALAEAVLLATERPSAIPLIEPGRLDADGDLRDQPEPENTQTIEDAAVPKASVPEAAPRPLPLPELTLGRSRPPEHEPLPPAPVVSPAREATADTDLPAVEAHCRLKAEGIRWSATRRRRMDEGAEFRFEIAPRDREILDRAGDLNCFLWMNTPDFTVPKETAALEDVAGWFEAVADAVALVREMLPDVDANREFFEPALDLLAEAQSALKVAIDRIDGPHDQDQFRVYDWLRGIAAREQIYIPRHMRLGDPADPAILPDFEARLEDLDTRFQEVRGRVKRRKSALNRLRYHAKLIGEGKGGPHDWRKVAGATDELMDMGVPASNVDVREVLLPVIDMMPEGEEFSQGFNLVLREIDRYLANRPSTAEVTAADVPTTEVAEATRLLKGKSVLLIGGVRRPEAHQSLKAAFGLEDLIWFETREHESIEVFEPYVARPEVAVVLLAIRWSSHSYEGVKRFCERHGKPMVRLPAGYGVNQVAAQIVSQCGERLGGG